MSSIIKPVLGSQPQIGHPLSRGLVGLWLFNEGSGNKVFDLSGNGRSLTLQGDTYWTAGKFGPVLQYDGTDDYSIYAGPIISGPPFTVISYFRCDELPSASGDERCIWSHADASANDWWRLRIDDADDKLEYGARQTPAGGVNATSAKAVIANKWHQATCVEVSSSERYVYLDAGSMGSNTTASVPTAANHTFAIGINMRLVQDPFDGAIGLTMIYNRALSASEIALLYREPFCMFERDPIELWVGATSIGAPPVGNAGIMTPNTGFWGPTF